MQDTFITGLVLGAVLAGLPVGFLLRRRLLAERRRAAQARVDLAATERHMTQLDEQLGLADRLFDSMPLPLFLLDRDSLVLKTNAAAIDLVDRDVAGRTFSSVFRQPDLVAAIEAVLENGYATMVELSLSVPVERVFLVRIEPVAAPKMPADPSAQPAPRRTAEENEPAVVVVMQDVTSVSQTERMRADFVANVSHELRTPLSSLIGFIETLRGPARDDREAHDRFLAIMQEQADRMYRLIADLLSLSRIELEEHTQPSNPVDITAVVHAVIDTVTFKAKDKGMTIELDFPESIPTITGDKDQLTQVLQNLVDNALKYGRENTVVTIAIKTTATTLTLSVQDRGHGISKDHLPRLTERFYRVDAARSRELGGTGLGLAIVKHIVNRHRGKFSVHSEQGVGSRFDVILPLR
ncbi:MAG: ATP-binding protein [Alphaproteobacteria bacterium]